MWGYFSKNNTTYKNVQKMVAVVAIAFLLLSTSPLSLLAQEVPPEEPQAEEIIPEEEPAPEPPTLTFSASPTVITEGESVSIEWSAENADTCSATDDWSGEKGAAGSESVSPALTSTYGLTCTGEGGEISDSATVTVEPVVIEDDPEGDSGTTTPEETVTEDTTSTSTTEEIDDTGNSEGGGHGTSTPDSNDGEDGENTEGGDTGTTTPDGVEDVDGEGEGGGEEGGDGTASSTATSTIETGNSGSSGSGSNNVNSNNLDVDPDENGDIEYSATSTNDADVGNAGTSTADSGLNTASTTGAAEIDTGIAFAELNLANIVNTNLYNSTGFLFLLNLLFGEGTFDLRDLFLTSLSDEAEQLRDEVRDGAPSRCSITECGDGDVEYNVVNTNTATVTNSAVVRSSTGENDITAGGDGSIDTGDAYAAANVVNLVNTNIIDSQYLVLAINNIGNYVGNIILPAADFFETLFSAFLPLSAPSVDIAINNTNTATVTNAIGVDANSGDNTATSSQGASIDTGNAYADANVVNQVNQNMVGGTAISFTIKVAGGWSGDLYGLPDGFDWEMTPGGIHIYSTYPGYSGGGFDSYSADITNTNTAVIENNVDVSAVTGENNVNAGGDASITTGDAYAAANVVNVANTNIIGQNWVLALFNILGDFDGDISFGMPDLWIGGRAESPDNPIRPGSPITYTYTITNNGDAKATGLVLDQSPTAGLLVFDEPEMLVAESNTSRWLIDEELDPGETIEVSYTGTVATEMPIGEVPVEVTASVMEKEPEANMDDNSDALVVGVLNGVQIWNTGGGFGGGGHSPSASPDLSITKTAANASDQSVDGGVDYTVTITNNGGRAYKAMLNDVITDEEGTVVNEQSWDLGTIFADEEIVIDYTVQFESTAVSGTYTNIAHLEAYDTPSGKSDELYIPDASAQIELVNKALEVFNVNVLSTYEEGGEGHAVIEWESNLPAGSQVVYGAGNGYILDEGAMELGYPESTLINDEESTTHRVSLAGLESGAEYSFRVISENSTDWAYSEEGTFEIPVHTALAPVGASEALAADDTDEEETETAPELISAEGFENAPEGQVAAAFLGFPLDIFANGCDTLMRVLLVALAVFLAWSFMSSVMKNFEEIGRRKLFYRNMAFSVAYIVLSGLAWGGSLLCYVWPLFAAALLAWVVQDVRAHRAHVLNEEPRQKFYVIALILAALYATITNDLGLVFPLMVMAFVTLVWWFIGQRKQNDS